MQQTGDLFAVWDHLQTFCKENDRDPDFECFLIVAMHKQTVLRMLGTGDWVGEDPGDLLEEVHRMYIEHPELVVK